MKNLIALIPLFLCAMVSRGQQAGQTVYYLADTIGVSPSNAVLSIQREGNFEGYVFYCHCIQNTSTPYPAFIYDVSKSQSKPTSEMPKHGYLSWKELEELLHQKQQHFDKFYTLVIVQKLPDGHYKENEVKLAVVRRTTTH